MMDTKSIDKCLKEVKLLQSLDHPNIIRYLEYCLSAEDLTIVVEWAAAGDLKRQLRKVFRVYKYHSRFTLHCLGNNAFCCVPLLLSLSLSIFYVYHLYMCFLPRRLRKKGIFSRKEQYGNTSCKSVKQCGY